VAGDLESRLERWVGAGLIEPAAAERIHAWEAAHPTGPGGARWPVRLTIALGGLLLCAGVLLFVAAHWDALAPGSRFALLVGAVALFHLAGAFAADRSPALSATLHACGTVALGGGIFLAGQIFNLEEHWPGGLLLWALGAWIGWALLRDWPQALLAALLTPAWLAGEWSVAAERMRGGPVLAVGVLLLALVYLGALPGPGGTTSAPRRALVWAGGLSVIPAVLLMIAVAHDGPFGRNDLPSTLVTAGWIVAVGGPLAVAAALRRPLPVALLALGAWAALGPLLADRRGVAPYLWTAALSLELIAWGIVERRSERINLGVAGFALTVLVFYFSSVMDRLGRSASLIGLGLLFLGGGWALERARRRLVARVSGSAA
jgi:uncharacterized membrane protein